MTSIIKTSVLRAAVLSAFDLGRYTVQFGVNPSGDDLAVVPASIVLDLAERDDDGFLDITLGETTSRVARLPHDDHGPAIPAQSVNTMADVAADLRGKPWPNAESDTIVERLNDTFSAQPVYDPRPAPEPPVGPLTSTEGLKVGDVLRVIWASKYGGMLGASDGEVAVVKDLHQNVTSVRVSMPTLEGGVESFDIDRFAYVGRPDADGWMDWPGGENPVGDALVEVDHRDEDWYSTGRASIWAKAWRHEAEERNIVRFRLIDTPPATSDI